MTPSEPTRPTRRAEVRIDEYEAILADTAGVSGRRQNTNDLFAGINALSLTAIGFLLVTSHFAFTDWRVTLAVVIVCIITGSLNRTWQSTLLSYKRLLAARHVYIEWIERKLREELGGEQETDDTLGPPNTPPLSPVPSPRWPSWWRFWPFSRGKERLPTEFEDFTKPDAAGMFLYLRQELFGKSDTFGFTRLELQLVQHFQTFYLLIGVVFLSLTLIQLIPLILNLIILLLRWLGH